MASFIRDVTACPTLSRLSALLFVVLLMVPAHASDAVRLQENFEAIGLTPYVQQTAADDYQFSLQNGSSQEINLVLSRARPSTLLRIFARDTQEKPALRLFTSDDTEFVAQADEPLLVRFQIPAGALQTFLLTDLDGMPQVYLWAAGQYMAYETRLHTMQLTLISLLLLLLALASFMAIYRRSRRGGYAVVMAAGLLALLIGLRADDVAKGSGVDLGFLADNSLVLQLALVFSIIMTFIGHLNLVLRKVVNRNYWTRVIIFADLCLLVSIGLFIAAFVEPGFAGVISNELAHFGLSLTTACMLLGVVFLPDRRASQL
jgi:hypothetical protein